MSLLLLIGIDLTTYVTLSPVTMTMSVVQPDVLLGTAPISKSASYTPVVDGSASYLPIIDKSGRAG